MSEIRFPRVLVFDSGVGGLSIAACIRKRLPQAAIVYLADNAAFPYGNQPESVVTERACTLITRALAQYPCDAVIVACNTASTIALPALRSATSVPVVGVVPAVKPAALKTRNQRIGILATPATVGRPYLDALVMEFATDCQVERLGHPALVQWAEDLVRGLPVPQQELEQAVAGLRTAGVDTVVLGCTHYPLLLENLKLCLPEVEYWVDSGDAIARRAAWLLSEAGLLGSADKDDTSLFNPTVVALFSGRAPAQVKDFMATLGLRPHQLCDTWCASG